MSKGATSVGSFGYVAVVDPQGNVTTPATSPTPGQTTSANSQSVTPASDSDFASKANQTNGSQVTGVNGQYTSTPTVASSGSRVPVLTNPLGSVMLAMDSNGNIGWDGITSYAAPQTRTATVGGAGATILPIGTVGGYYDPTGTAQLRIARGDSTGAWVHGPTSTPVMQGGTIAASGGTAAITFVNTSDTEIVNPSTSTLWGSWGTPAVNGANSYPIAPNGSYRPPNRPAGTFTLLSTAANQTYTATRF